MSPLSYGSRIWLSGLISAASSGALGALGMVVIDPTDFHLEHPAKLAAATALFVVIGVLNFLKQSPLPDSTGSAISPSRFVGKD